MVCNPLHEAWHAAADPGLVDLLRSNVLHSNSVAVAHPLRRSAGAPVVVLPAGQSAQPPPLVVRVPYLPTTQGQSFHEVSFLLVAAQ